MRAFFISYRRDDAEGQAGRLFDDLVQHFGEQAVFMDVAGIEPGRDFRKAIDEHVATCGVLLALIGKNWLDAQDEAGRRRLDDPQDFVRLEIASALKRAIPVVPVLVQGARMPQVGQLPTDLADLSFRNAIELSHARWDSDVAVLVKGLERHRTPNEPNASQPAVALRNTRPARLPLVARVGLAGVVGALGLYFLLPRAPKVAREDTAPLQRQQTALPDAAAASEGAREVEPVQDSKKGLRRPKRQPEAEIDQDTKQRQGDEPRAAERLAPRLAGDWTWGQQPCAEGPRVSLVKDRIVFAHSGPDFIHAIVSDDGSKLRTKVLAPADHAGEVYEFQLNGARLALSQPQTGERNVWVRCER